MLIAGNWKMFKTASETEAFCRAVRDRLTGLPAGVDVAVCPPFTGLAPAVTALAGTEIAVAAQNVHWEPEGPFTGEVSAAMLRELGVYGAIVGHSERRQHFGETDETVARRARAALDAGLSVIACVGELEEERERGETQDVLRRQVGVLDGHENLVIAYEPVWAIGTGKTATPAQAQEAHALIRSLLDVPVLYGGSVKPENAAELLRQPAVDGALVGGASLEVESWGGRGGAAPPGGPGGGGRVPGGLVVRGHLRGRDDGVAFVTSAVLFDWGDTLAGDAWTDELYRSATADGLEAVGREGLPEPGAIARCVAERERELAPPGGDDEVDLVAVHRECLRELGSPLTPDELEAYLTAVHAFWASIEQPHPDAGALLDGLRSRGVRLAIVANASSPRRHLEPVLAEQDLLERVDVVVFSSDVGKRKPHPAVFERALAAVDVRPTDAVFVGDRLYEDVLGASRLGMATVQATWFVDDASERGAKPDARAGSPLEVLELIDG